MVLNPCVMRGAKCDQLGLFFRNTHLNTKQRATGATDQYARIIITPEMSFNCS